MYGPTILMRLFVYFGWIASMASIIVAMAVRSNKRLSTFVADIPLSKWMFTTIVLAVGTYLLVISQELSGIVAYNDSFPVIDAAVRTIRLFSASDSAPIVEEVLDDYFAPGFRGLYSMSNSLAHLAAPVDTLVGIFLLASRIFGGPRLRLQSSRRDTFVFSRLDDRTLALAKSIEEHYAKSSLDGEAERCVIAFAGSQVGSGGLYESALTNHMVCLEQPMRSIMHYLNGKRTRRVFVFWNEDEKENLHDGIEYVRLLAKFDRRRAKGGTIKPAEVHMLSTAPAAESLVDAAVSDSLAEDGNGMPLVYVRRVDWVRNTVESILWLLPLFLVSKPSDEDAPQVRDALYAKTRRRVAIVGTDALCREFLKSALWCAQMEGISFTFDLIDTAGGSHGGMGVSATRAHFEQEMPEVLRLNGPTHAAEYHINFLDIDPESGAYVEYLKANRDELTYLLVSPGDDLLNVQVAKRTREILEQGRYDASHNADRVDRPLVCVVVRDEQLAKSVVDMRTGKGVSYDLVTVGAEDQVHSYDNLFRPEIERVGRNINRAYWGVYDMADAPQSKVRGQLREADGGYERLEYNRRSSRASAIHLKYKLFCFLRSRLLAGDSASEPLSSKTWTGSLATPEKGGDPKLSALVDAYQRYIYDEVQVKGSVAGIRWLSAMEHDRWAAYVRVEGYETADERTFLSYFPVTKENQDRLSKRHICLVPFDELSHASAFAYPVTGKPSDQDYERLDDQIVEHLGEIVRDFR